MARGAIVVRVALGLAGLALALLTLRHVDSDVDVTQVFGTLDREGAVPGSGRTTLWGAEATAAALLVAGGVGLLRGGGLRGRLALAASVVGLGLGLAGVLAAPDGVDPGEASYVLRGYGATQYSGVLTSDGYPRGAAWVVLGLAAALGAARALLDRGRT